MRTKIPQPKRHCDDDEDDYSGDTSTNRDPPSPVKPKRKKICHSNSSDNAEAEYGESHIRKSNNRATDDSDSLKTEGDVEDENYFGPFAPLHGYKGRSIASKEQETGQIRFQVIRNDGTPASMVLLTNLKLIFQKQLPKMPKEYIGRLVYDPSHTAMAIIKSDGYTVVGGITYKPFFERKFAEIVFCAITTDEQVKGYGSHLMNHLKAYVRSTGDIRHFLTYADNYAIGYFKKQGFSTVVTLDRRVWAGYIKDYEGGTIMHCTIVPRVDYLNVRKLLFTQHRAICERIKQLSSGRVIHPGLTRDQLREIANDPMKIPGIKESGWTPEVSAAHSKSVQRPPLYRLCIQLVDDMRSNTHSWPFLEPVDAKQVADYYEVISDPMDLQTLEKRVDAEWYPNLEAFKKDVQKIFDNCRTYNNPSTGYYKCANKLEEFFKSKLRTREEILEEMRRDELKGA